VLQVACALASSLEAELGAPPVAALGVVPDGVISTQPDPLRDGAVLLLLLGKDGLHPEALLRRHLASGAASHLLANARQTA